MYGLIDNKMYINNTRYTDLRNVIDSLHEAHHASSAISGALEDVPNAFDIRAECIRMLDTFIITGNYSSDLMSTNGFGLGRWWLEGGSPPI